MTDTINTRELIMNILLEMDAAGPCVYQAGLRGNRGIRHPE